MTPHSARVRAVSPLGRRVGRVPRSQGSGRAGRQRPVQTNDRRPLRREQNSAYRRALGIDEWRLIGDESEPSVGVPARRDGRPRPDCGEGRHGGLPLQLPPRDRATCLCAPEILQVRGKITYFPQLLVFAGPPYTRGIPCREGLVADSPNGRAQCRELGPQAASCGARLTRAPRLGCLAEASTTMPPRTGEEMLQRRHGGPEASDRSHVPARRQARATVAKDQSASGRVWRARVFASPMSVL